MSADTATIVYSYFFVAAALMAGMSMIAKHTIQKHTDELKDKLYIMAILSIIKDNNIYK